MESNFKNIGNSTWGPIGRVIPYRMAGQWVNARDSANKRASRRQCGARPIQVRDENDDERERRQRQNPTEPIRETGDKRLIIMDEAFASGLACTKREGNTLSMGIRCFWDSGDYAPLTKNNPVMVRGAHISIITHITMQELAVCLGKVQTVNGCVALLFRPPKKERITGPAGHAPEQCRSLAERNSGPAGRQSGLGRDRHTIERTYLGLEAPGEPGGRFIVLPSKTTPKTGWTVGKQQAVKLE